MRKLTLAAVCLAATLQFAPLASATTLPTKTVLIDIVYFPGRMVVAQYQGETLGNGTPGFQAFVGSIPRGSFLKFIVINRSKQTHQFTAFGKTSKRVKPGGKVTFQKYAKTRGKFPYRDLVTTGKTYHGVFVIY